MDGRYRLDRVLDATPGDTPGTACYLGTRLEDGLKIHVACLALPASAGEERDKPLRLGQLQHTFLPRWLDGFVASIQGERALWLVHAHTRGPTLARLIEAGERADEAAAHELLTTIGSALAYLHALEPPIVHGSISPRSLQRRSIDDRWAIVEPPGVRGSGDAGPADDLRDLGLALLAWLGVEGETTGWRERLSLDPDLVDLITSMVEPGANRLTDGSELCSELARFVPATATTADCLDSRLLTRAPGRPRRAALDDEDRPVQRPDELSRELSEAHRAISALEGRSRRHRESARAMVIVLVAVAAGLLTWAALGWVH